MCSLAQFFKPLGYVSKNRVVGELMVEKIHPWGIFDGACQGHEQIYGIGGVFYISDSHYF